MLSSHKFFHFGYARLVGNENCVGRRHNDEILDAEKRNPRASRYTDVAVGFNDRTGPFADVAAGIMREIRIERRETAHIVPPEISGNDAERNVARTGPFSIR